MLGELKANEVFGLWFLVFGKNLRKYKESGNK